MKLEKAIIITAALSGFGMILGGCSDGHDATPSPKDGPSIQAPQAISASSIKIVFWGPRSTPAGESFNVQPNGDSALWFEQRGIPHSSAVRVYWDDTPLPNLIVNPDKVGTVSIPKDLLAKPGVHNIYLVVPPKNDRVDIGVFEVKAGG